MRFAAPVLVMAIGLISTLLVWVLNSGSRSLENDTFGDLPADVAGKGKRDTRYRVEAKGVVLSMAISPKGSFLVVNSHGRVYVFEAATGKRLYSIEPTKKEKGFWNVVFGKENHVFACASDEGMEIRDVTTGRLLRIFKGAVYGWSRKPSDGTYLVGCDPRYDEGIKIYDWTPKEIQTIRFENSQEEAALVPYELAFAPDGKTLAVCGFFMRLETWDIAKGRLLRRFTETDQKFTCVAFSPDGLTIAASDANGLIRLWDAAKGTLKQRWQTGTKPIEQIRFAPDGKTLAACGHDEIIRRFDPLTGKQFAEIKTGEQQNHCLAFTPDSKRLFSTGFSELIRQWDMKTGREIGGQKMP